MKRIKNFFKVIKMKYFCKHNMNFVKDSPYYIHLKCEKCGYEFGVGNIKTN
jgi:hypothetical protein